MTVNVTSNAGGGGKVWFWAFCPDCGRKLCRISGGAPEDMKVEIPCKSCQLPKVAKVL